MILPRPDAAFAWKETAVAPALMCTPLEDVARHLFTTRAFMLGAIRTGDEPWQQLASVMGVAGMARLRQVHGPAFVVAGQDVPGEPPAADIILAGVNGPAVAVQGADCVPLLMADRRLGVVAAAHAGWRGLAMGVPRETVNAMRRTFGSRPDNLLAAIGPSIGSCCYEVGPDVRDAFQAGGFAKKQVRGWFHPSPTPTTGNPSMPGLRTPAAPEHTFFDGWACAIAQLEEVGIPSGQIFCARLCTASHPAVFCSYRLEGASAGRIAGAIAPRERR